MLAGRRKSCEDLVGIGAVLPLCDLFGISPDRTAGIEPELANLIKQRLVADAQHLRGILAAPMSFFERVGDRFHFGFVLQTAYERLQSLLACGGRFLPWRNALPCGGHF